MRKMKDRLPVILDLFFLTMIKSWSWTV